MKIFRTTSYGLILFALLMSMSGISSALAAPDLQGTVKINEIRIDQPSTDIDEYFELAGPAGTSLDGLTYLVIGDGSGGSGVIEAVVDLTGYAIPGSGYFVAAESTFTLGTADLTTNLNFENSDNVTHLLVSGFTGSNGEDLDTNDDGTLDSEPWTAVLDSVALIASVGSGDLVYSATTVGPDGSYVPGQVYRCGGGWEIGDFDPTGGTDTPGGANPCTYSPDVLISEIRIDQPGSDYDEYFELAGPAGTSLDGLTYLVIGDGSGGSGVIEAVVALAGNVIPGSGYFVAAEGTFTLGTANLTTNLNFENSDNVTHLLVSGFTGSNGEDLDTNDDGTLDSEPWTAVLDSVALIASVGSGDLVYSATTVGPDGSYVPGHVYRCEDGWRIGPFGGGGDTPGAANPCAFGFCGAEATYIHDIQGPGFTSPYDGSQVTVEAVVVGDFDQSNQLRGFFLQEEDTDADGSLSTSEGIFVYTGGSGPDVSAGDVVRVRGTIDEYYDLTEITNVLELQICSSEAAVTPAAISMPVSGMEIWERSEGMLVEINEELTVTGNYTLGRYGEVDLSAGGRLFNPTNIVEPGTPAQALQAANDLRRVQLDDGSTVENPVPPPPYFGPDGTLRAGDTTDGLIGALGYAFGTYEIHPVEAVTFTRVNQRLSPPDVGGDVTVASFNVLNYFTTIDDGSAICGPDSNQDCRGADTDEEFVRQRDKIIAAIVDMDADVVGLMEIENHPDDAAVIDLVQGLNDAAGAGTYDYIATGPIGTDAIKVALIYQPAVVSPYGAYAVLDSSVDARFVDTKNRPVLAQTFADGDGALFTVAVNHLKSKGSDCNDLFDPDTGDGQGNCNLTRLHAAQALADWLASDPTGSQDADAIIIGDLNSYAMEDPIAALEAAGYANLIEAYGGEYAYSYVFQGQAGYLDHALANPTLALQVTGNAVWHINADEPVALDYNNYNQPSLYHPDPYASSDHDPVLTGLNPNLAPVCDMAYPSLDELWPANHKFTSLEILGVTDPDGDALSFTIESIFQDEAVDDGGDGATAPDAIIGVGNGFELRAERAGDGDGRVYHIRFTVDDGHSGTCIGEVLVSVPHDSGKDAEPAIDGGGLYDSTVVPEAEVIQETPTVEAVVPDDEAAPAPTAEPVGKEKKEQ